MYSCQAIEITKGDLKKCHTADLGTEHEPSDKKKECLEDTKSEDDPWKISTVYIKVVPWDGKNMFIIIYTQKGKSLIT